MRKRPSRIFLFFALFLILAGAAFAQEPQDPSLVTARARLAAGVNLFSQGKWQEAVMELRRAQAEAPAKEMRGEALFWISLAELSAGDYEEALYDMDALAAEDPENRRLGELAYHRGRCLYSLGRFDEAILALAGYADNLAPGPDGALSSADSSRKAAAFFWTGECLFSMGQLDKAADVFHLIVEEYPGSAKYEASVYRLALINQKKVEAELLGLLKMSHEESLRNMEEYRQRESSYDQALSAYQKRIAEMEGDTRLQNLEETNAQYREQLDSAEERIRSLESAREAEAAERLKALKDSAAELEAAILENGK